MALSAALMGGDPSAPTAAPCGSVPAPLTGTASVLGVKPSPGGQESGFEILERAPFDALMSRSRRQGANPALSRGCRSKGTPSSDVQNKRVANWRLGVIYRWQVAERRASVWNGL